MWATWGSGPYSVAPLKLKTDSNWSVTTPAVSDPLRTSVPPIHKPGTTSFHGSSQRGTLVARPVPRQGWQSATSSGSLWQA
ncbi:MAG TPA: hypothetical protein VFK41_02225 [Nocardioidaceae bacterium]|nr:hypothetical protein [Nocardioidaceae bacterium]